MKSLSGFAKVFKRENEGPYEKLSFGSSSAFNNQYPSELLKYQFTTAHENQVSAPVKRIFSEESAFRVVENQVGNLGSSIENKLEDIR